jgi:phosphate ABC transporter permease protein PstC
MKKTDKFAKSVMLVCSSVCFLGIILIFFFILKESLPAFTQLGPANLFSLQWSPNVSDPAAGQYGMLAFLNGSIMTTLGGLLIGAPLGVAAAVFIDQVAPRGMSKVISQGIALLAGIPSVVIGWFGLTRLVPFLARISGTGGDGILAASLVLGVMTLPTITFLSLEALRALPREHREASLAMGATRWQTIYRVLVPTARRGILVAVILGMGRAIGETMAVQMVIGNARQIAWGPFQRTSTLPSRIITDMGESSGLFRNALFAQGLVLLLLAMLLILAMKLVTRERKGYR